MSSPAAALDAGADPAVVTGWIAQTQAERTRAEAELSAIAGVTPRRMSRPEWWRRPQPSVVGLRTSFLVQRAGTPAPLNRLVNAAQQTSNYNRSCPSSYPRPAGLSCDEYPFQSSQQGAATGGGGPGRTFGGCQVPLPAGTGPSGYSACMIDNTQNSEGGSALGSFYIDQRIFNADPFYVWITP